jgi:hypothetical protein
VIGVGESINNIPLAFAPLQTVVVDEVVTPIAKDV